MIGVRSPMQVSRVQHAPTRSTIRQTSRQLVCQSFQVRPYTLRRGDTLSSIAEKRDIDLQQLIKLNHDIDPNNVQEDQTILVPVGKLSDRDRLILDGVGRGRGQYRTYPIRKGEQLDDVLSKRNITMDEFTKLNPDINPSKVSGNTIIKLPSNKYTTREKEMLVAAGAPMDFFRSESQMKYFGFGIVIGFAVYGAITYMYRRNKDD